MNSIIELKNVRKEFKIRKRYDSALKTFFEHKYNICAAVKDINLTINKGEAVGVIGPNGAGKSTTIKMMTGILQPTKGEIKVMGMNPYKDRKAVVKRIGVVFGQRSQLWWDIPVIDSFKLLAKIYEIPYKSLMEKLYFFDSYLTLSEFWKRPVRQLSLGQKMRAEFVASLLHEPEIVFLDEPTIGLDIVAKRELRNLIVKINEEMKTTIILTSHDMADIEEIAHRIILINEGSILIDSDVSTLKDELGYMKTIKVVIKEEIDELQIENCETNCIENSTWEIKFNHNFMKANEIIDNLSKKYTVIDLSVTSPSIEAILQELYDK